MLCFPISKEKKGTEKRKKKRKEKKGKVRRKEKKNRNERKRGLTNLMFYVFMFYWLLYVHALHEETHE